MASNHRTGAADDDRDDVTSELGIGLSLHVQADLAAELVTDHGEHNVTGGPSERTGIADAELSCRKRNVIPDAEVRELCSGLPTARRRARPTRWKGNAAFLDWFHGWRTSGPGAANPSERRSGVVVYMATGVAEVIDNAIVGRGWMTGSIKCVR